MSEIPISAKLQLVACRIGDGVSRLFRNFTGSSWVGKVSSIKDRRGAVIIEGARKVSSGLCVGSSDNIGWHSVLVTPDMVGKRVAIFLAVEVKFGKTRSTEAQENFIRQVNAAGGIGFIARSVEDFELALKEWNREFRGERIGY